VQSGIFLKTCCLEVLLFDYEEALHLPYDLQLNLELSRYTIDTAATPLRLLIAIPLGE